MDNLNEQFYFDQTADHLLILQHHLLFFFKLFLILNYPGEKKYLGD